MLRHLRNIIISALLILLVSGCRKNYSLNEDQSILFQFDYVNYAWGYQHQGFIIDNGGNVFTYTNPEGWNFPDKDLVLSESEAAENIAKCTETGMTIGKTDLLKYSSYIKNISQSKVTARKNTGADGGTSTYLCYQYSGNSGMYKGYLIKMEGDFSCENLNFYSKKVATWMKDIHRQAGH